MLACMVASCSYFDEPQPEMTKAGVTKPEMAKLEKARPVITSINQNDLTRFQTDGAVEVFTDPIPVGAGNGGTEDGPMLTWPAGVVAQENVNEKAKSAQNALVKASIVPFKASRSTKFDFDTSVEIFPIDDEMRVAMGLPDDTAVVVSRLENSTPGTLIPALSDLGAFEEEQEEVNDQTVPLSQFDLSYPAPTLTPPSSVPRLPQFALNVPEVTPQAVDAYVAQSMPEENFIKVFFNHNVMVLKPDEKPVLADLVKNYANYNSVIFSVEGHASQTSTIRDPAQRRIANLRVSLERAFAVAQTLIKHGVPAEKIRLVAWGDTRPSGAMDGKDAESASRRVEIRPLSRQ